MQTQFLPLNMALAKEVRASIDEVGLSISEVARRFKPPCARGKLVHKILCSNRFTRGELSEIRKIVRLEKARQARMVRGVA